MTHELRRLLEEELAGEMPPPLGDVVRVSVHSGRRVRRRRRLLAGAGGGATAAVLAAAGVFALAVGPPSTPARPAAVDASPRVNVAASQPEASSPALSVVPSGCVAAGTTEEAAETGGPATECLEPLDELDLTLPSPSPYGTEFGVTTAAGALELLTSLLPEGKTNGYAYGPPAKDEVEGAVSVQAYLDRGDGFGMLRLSVGRVDPQVKSVDWPSCRPPARGCVEIIGLGLLVVESDPTDCTRFYAVSLQREDGVQVTLRVADCLMWDGRQNPAGAVALSLQEAVTVVLNPVWGPTMPISLIKTGELHHPELTPIVGG